MASTCGFPCLATDPCPGDPWRALAANGGSGRCDERRPGVRDWQLWWTSVAQWPLCTISENILPAGGARWGCGWPRRSVRCQYVCIVMSSPRVESQGCHLIPFYYLLSWSPAYSHRSFCPVFFLPTSPLSWLFFQKMFQYFLFRDRLHGMALV